MSLFNQRNGFNMNAPNVEANYCYLDHTRHFGQTVIGGNWSATTPGFNQVMGTTEWPENAIARTVDTRLVTLIPDYANYAGPYTIDWFGDARIFLSTINTGVTINASSANVTISGGGSQIFTNNSSSSGSSFVTFTINDPAPGTPISFNIDFRSDVVASNNTWANHIRMYRGGIGGTDYNRLAAGKLFRTEYLTTISNLCPGFIRFLNWISWTNPCARAEHLGDPTKASYGSWTVSPAYGQTAGSANAYTLAGVAADASHPATPATMQHGEIVTCRMDRAITREGGTSIYHITNANPGHVYCGNGIDSVDSYINGSGVTTLTFHNSTGLSNGSAFTLDIQTGTGGFAAFNGAWTVTTVVPGTDQKQIIFNGPIGANPFTIGNGGIISANGVPVAHGFNTGDIILPALGDGVMPKLRNFPVTITKINNAEFTIGLDTTTYGTFSQGPQGTFPFVSEYVSLAVSAPGGGSRGAYPVMFRTQCNLPISSANITGGQLVQINPGDYKTFYFDKGLAGITNGTTGDWVTGTNGTNSGGCWMMTIDSGNANGADVNWPVEHMVEFTNEVNEISVAAGRCTSDCWIPIPGRGLITSNSADFDQDYTSGSNMPLVLTGKVINGANGFNGLLNNAYFWAELGNEWWNSGSFPQSYGTVRGYQRWNAGAFGNTIDFYLLRTVITMRAIKAAFPTAKINYVLGGFAAISPTPGSINYQLCNGSTNYNTDIVTLTGLLNAPIVDHDCLATAPYTDPNSTYMNSQFATDSALYATGISSNMTAAMNSLVTNGYITGGGPGLGLSNHYNVATHTGLQPDFATFMAAFAGGKRAVNYEGGLEAITLQGSSADRAFLVASYRSSQWNTAQNAFWDGMVTFYSAGFANPSVLLPMSNAPLLAAPNYQSRWAYAVPDNYLGGVEGANLPAGAVWAGMSARNIALCGGSATLPSGGGSQSQGFKYGVFKSRPVKIPHA